MEPTSIPTLEEIAALPQVARAAFAARCARRVLPVWRSYQLHYGNEDTAGTPDSAVVQAELATHLGGGMSESAYTDYAYLAADAADHATNPAAAAAARAAARAVDAVASVDNKCLNDAAFGAAQAAAFACDAVSGGSSGMIRRDFDVVREAAIAGNWDDITPVRPEVFGELWPDGPPAGWPTEEGTPAQPPSTSPSSKSPVLEVYIDPGNASKKTLQNVLDALSDLHMAHGGLGLEFSVEDNVVYAFEVSK